MVPKPKKNDEGKILIAGKNGNVYWENPTGLSIETILNNKSLEKALEELILAWKKFQMLKNLCKE